ncbi:ABC transporter permease [Clostridium beijerinckii]|uniref:ABC transporter permease n=1 Tax=Clostridium beijerinckii TaxID=1520 RepID=UPI00080A1338|nr:ABC transporter permease [Clostridium beijerinckii]OCA96393.1 ABC transporter permease [Clostridium beijerinckii]
MFNIIYSEFMKLKKSYIWVIVFISGCLLPGVNFFNAITNDFSNLSQVQIQHFIKNQMINAETLSFQFLFIIVFSLVVGYVFTREFTDKTANILYTYPSSRIKIFIGKFITVGILIMITYLIQFFISYLVVYIAFGVLPPAEFIIKDMKVNIYSALLQLVLVPVPALIASIAKNIIAPIVYGALGGIIGLGVMTILMSGSIYGQLCPLVLPALPFYHYHRGDPIDYISVVGSAVITFGISMFLCIYHSKNADVN